MTNQELEQLLETWRAATPPPWYTEPKGKATSGPAKGFAIDTVICAVARGQCVYADPPGGIAPEANRKAIAAAFNAIEPLVKKVRELQEKLAKEKEVTNELQDLVNDEEIVVIHKNQEIQHLKKQVADLQSRLTAAERDRDKARNALKVIRKAHREASERLERRLEQEEPKT